jgi:type IV pilus assembly protein PilC
MVRAGEESGKLDQTFSFLADNLEQSYLLTSKAKNALIYPAFVIITFIGVMVLMLTTVIPKLSAVLIESGKEVPIYTKVVLGISDFFVNYGIFMLFAVIIGGFSLWRWSKTSGGQSSLAEIKLTVPYLGSLYRKLYLARIASNLNTMLLSAIPIIKSLELTASIVGNRLFEKAILESADAVKAGSPISGAFAKHREFPGIMVAMIRVGEETGEMGEILKTLSRFYQREVFEAVDTLVGLIEPVMIVGLGLAVGFLIASVLVPIYNISSGA